MSFVYRQALRLVSVWRYSCRTVGSLGGLGLGWVGLGRGGDGDRTGVGDGWMVPTISR